MIQFKFLDLAVPEGGWPWTVSLCEITNPLFCLVQLDFLL